MRYQLYVWMAGCASSPPPFRPCFSKPQHRYFEIVLLALLLCLEAKTLSGLLRQVAVRPPSPASAASSPRLPGLPPRSLTPGARASTPRWSR